MPGARDLKRRIKGIKNTGKITRAMEMISAVKMRKSVARVLAIRPYAEGALQVFTKVSRATREDDVIVLQDRPVKSVLIVVVTSNRGLCGSFNAQVIRQVKNEIIRFESQENKLEKIDFLSIGKKGDQMLRKFSGEIIASFPDIAQAVKIDDVRGVARLIRDDYENGKYDKVMLVYTDYVSPMIQKTRVRRLLPVSQGAVQDEVLEMNVLNDPSGTREETLRQDEDLVSDLSNQYAIEPDPASVLKMLIPRLVEMQLYHAILESNASQEAARMMAMRNATDAAKEMADDFTLAYNQMRQARVTQEIAELSAGMAAVG